MIKYLIGSLALIGTLILSCPDLAAQQKTTVANTPQRRAESQTKFLSKKFGLSENISGEIYLINVRFEIMADSIRMSNSSDALKTEAFKLGALKRREAYKKVMTPEQFLNYTKFVDEMRMKAQRFRESKK